jgi:hypothetical protein
MRTDFKSIAKLEDYTEGPSDEMLDLDIDMSIIEDLVDLVGSEEEVENAAKEAYEELKAAFERGDMEETDEEPGESLAIASLIVKLVELGKLGPQEADEFIKEKMPD